MSAQAIGCGDERPTGKQRTTSGPMVSVVMTHGAKYVPTSSMTGRGRRYPNDRAN